MFLSRFVRNFGGPMAVEGVQQRLISSLPKSIKVDDSYFRYTIVQRFRQAGITMIKAPDGEADTVVGARNVNRDYCPIPEMPRRDPVTSRLTLSLNGEDLPRQGTKQSALTCVDPRTGERFAFYSGMGFDPSHEDTTKFLFSKGKLRAVIDNFPHVLWDNGQGGAK